MNVCLLEPTASVLGLSTYAAHNILEPLGLEYLASYLEGQGRACSVLQQRCEERDAVLASVKQSSPDVLGISAQAYNIDDAMWFARETKRVLPEVTVVLGGYHPSAIPEIAAKPEVDYVVMGEGEVPFAGLLAALADKGDLSKVPGIAYHDGALHVNPPPPRIEGLDGLPFPKRSESILAQCRMHGLMLPPPSQQRNVGMVTATRGCPYNCAFCCSDLIWRQQVRRRSPGNVADELAVLANQYHVNGVFFCDLTFNASKKYAIQLCEEIARRDVPIHFYAMCNLRGMDREIAEAMAAAKCAKVGFGIESFLEPTRHAVKDGGGMDVDEANAVLEDVAAAGLLVKTYFIIGFPWETKELLEQLRQDVCRLQADEIKATFYVPFPGTRGYEMHKSLLTTTDWSSFTTLSEPVVRNEHLTPEELKLARRAIFDSFYNGPQWLQRVTERVASFPQYADSFTEFVLFLKQQGILRQGLLVPAAESRE